MATFVLTDASVIINNIDLSDHVRSLTLNYEAESVDDSTMSVLTRIAKGGLLNYSFDVEFAQDFAASEVDATLFSLVGTTTTVVIKPTSGAVSSTNPSFTGTMMLQNYNPIQGSVGDFATAPVHFEAAGTLTRATS